MTIFHVEEVHEVFCVEEASSSNLDGVVRYRHSVVPVDVYAEQAPLERAG